jgi:hypothetical protein
MHTIIENFQPDFWIYGHTHECSSHSIGKTHLIANSLGYFQAHGGSYECQDAFDKYGCGFDLADESHGISSAMQEWDVKVMEGIKRMNEDEEYRKEIASRLP